MVNLLRRSSIFYYIKLLGIWKPTVSLYYVFLIMVNSRDQKEGSGSKKPRKIAYFVNVAFLSLGLFLIHPKARQHGYVDNLLGTTPLIAMMRTNFYFTPFNVMNV